MTRTSLLVFSLLTWSALSAHAQTLMPASNNTVVDLSKPLSLQDAIRIAVRLQPQQRIAQSQIKSAKGQQEQAEAQYFPTVTPSYSYQNQRTDYYGVGVPNITTANGQSYAASSNVSVIRGGGLSVSVDQTLFDSGARELSNAQARHAVESALQGSVNTQQEVILSVVEDYYDLLEAIDLLNVAQANVQTDQQTVDLTQAEITAGTVAPKDIYQTKANLATAIVTQLQDRNSVATAVSNLKNIMGVETETPIIPIPLAANGQLPPVPTSLDDTTIDSALAQAVANRPDLLQALASVKSSNAAVKSAEIKGGISFSSNYLLTYQASNDVGAKGTDSQVLVSGTVPLDAGATRGAIREAQAARDQANASLDLTRQTVRQQVEIALSTRDVSYQATQSAQAAVQAAQVNVDSETAARKAGVATVLDVTTAQSTLVQAQNQYVEAAYGYYIADAQLKRAVGTIDSIAGTAAPPVK